MAAQQEQTSNEQNNFEKRHENELGVKRFATIAGINFIVPLATAAIGAGIGYLTLGKSVKHLGGKWIKWGAEIPELINAVRGFQTDKLPELYSEISRVSQSAIARIKEQDSAFAVNSIDNLIKVINHSSETEAKAIRDVLNMKDPNVLQVAKYVAAGVGFFFGSMFGGTAIHYKEWKKDESARLAAAEVNKNISELELFKPSDTELVAENKRLRAMLAAKDGDAPDAKITNAAAAGKIISPATAEVTMG